MWWQLTLFVGIPLAILYVIYRLADRESSRRASRTFQSALNADYALHEAECRRRGIKPFPRLVIDPSVPYKSQLRG